VLGQDASVRAAIDAAAAASPSLASSSGYRRAASAEPADRVLDAYASVAGLRRILSARTGALGALGRLLDQPALEGLTVSISPAPGGARIRVHSALDPSLVRVAGGRAEPFTPSLARELPSGSTLMLDVSDLSRVVPRVLGAGASSRRSSCRSRSSSPPRIRAPVGRRRSTTCRSTASPHISSR
jgi:Protein of unknown function (DUF3352)